ncbi:hypothetical protein DPMN_145425 [Dreissena polymorpha]|uniref:Uncharacterized protein n=1 Tax=Dreissena polymorpha TaxID=45954 RepID=A0A9D4F3Z8_DREPO|nr:hypothetical protein DPMN_145425 [Dreissena polymorpha]
MVYSTFCYAPLRNQHVLLLRSSPRFASRYVSLCCDQHDWLPRSTPFRYVLLRSPTTKPLCCDLLRFDRLENESGQSW